MPFRQYKTFNFRPASLAIIEQANSIIAEYKKQDYDLTLRQLYYQFVARDIIPNNVRAYKKLGSIVNDGRLAGLINWDAIEDRTRPSRGITHWDSPQEIITAIGRQFHIDTRADQDTYIEVWVEKDALVGVLERACDELDVPYMSCRGYVSQSSMWEAAQRFIKKEDCGKETYLIYLGDHDPSGINMPKDIQYRLRLFKSTCELRRIALTMSQVEEYSPPPNFAKETDSRHKKYQVNFGDNSWELDALEPRIISELIDDAVGELTSDDDRNHLIDMQELHRAKIIKVAQNWDKLTKKL